MIFLDQRTLRALQMIQLELLLEVDRICKKNAISYNIIAGTLLGAVRHGGYIPWDDDADVALLREEYERFRIACVTDLDHERFYFQDHRNTPGYRWGYGKLRRKTTEFIREHQEHMPYESGVFIDIFPLDQVPDKIMLRVLNNLHCYVIRKILWSKVGKKADSRRLARLLYRILSLVPEKVTFGHLDRFIQKANRKPSHWVRIMTFPTPNRQYGYRKEWYQVSGEYEFEGQVLMGIKQYDDYLTFKFGDYMKLPPEHLRKTHPVSKLKLTENERVYDD